MLAKGSTAVLQDKYTYSVLRYCWKLSLYNMVLHMAVNNVLKQLHPVKIMYHLFSTVSPLSLQILLVLFTGVAHQGLRSLRWRQNDHDGVSNHQPHGCLLNRLFRRRSKKTSKLRVTGLCAGNSPVTGEFPAQRASNAENVSIWWRHHEVVRWIPDCQILKNTTINSGTALKLVTNGLDNFQWL